LVNILDRFEQSFEQLLDSSVGRLFRSPIQPAEIGRKLERALLSNQVTSVDSTLVPNDYRVAMNPQDMVVFADYVTALCRQMESWLTELAAERSFTLIDRMRVQINGDSGIPRRVIQVTAAIADRPDFDHSEQEAIQRTEVYRVIKETSGMPPMRLRFASGPFVGEEMILRKPFTTIGRALDNDVVLESSEVSRYHARLEYTDGQMRLVDLNSTNGTRVNGKAIRVHAVGPGDEVLLGTLSVRVLPFASNGR
jgi:small nuclear ribonucleoprotein (snRNP)-like protein